MKWNRFRVISINICMTKGIKILLKTTQLLLRHYLILYFHSELYCHLSQFNLAAKPSQILKWQIFQSIWEAFSSQIFLCRRILSGKNTRCVDFDTFFSSFYLLLSQMTTCVSPSVSLSFFRSFTHIKALEIKKKIHAELQKWAAHIHTQL